MGRAAKLRQQRKQKQQRLSSPPLTSNSPENSRELDQAFNRIASALIDWLLEQWSTVPHFTLDFTVDEAKRIANEALALLLKDVEKKPGQNVSIEWAISDRFTIHIFFNLQLLSIDTLVVDNIDKKIFDLPGEITILSHNPKV